MALTIVQQPSGSNMAYTRLPYVISGSTNDTQPQFRYVMDVYLSGSSDLITRVTQPLNPAGVAVFDPSRIFQDTVNYDNNWYTTGSIELDKSLYTFNVQFGEQYGTSTSSSVSITTNIASNNILVVPGAVDPNNGVGFDFQPSSSLGAGGILTNHPQSKYSSAFQTIGPDTTITLNNDDYHTVTFFQEVSSVTLNLYSTSSIITSSVISGSGERFQTFGIGPKNLIEYNSASFSSWFSNPNAAYINVTPNPAFQAGAANIYDYNIKGGTSDKICDNEYVRFAFINEYGFYDYYNVYNPIRKISDLKRESVDLPQLSYSDATAPYDILKRGQTDYYTDRQDRYILTTEFLTKETADWLLELFESPEVFVQETGLEYDASHGGTIEEDITPYTKFIPIVVTNTNVVTNDSTARNKLFQYTIEFKFANKRAGAASNPLGQEDRGLSPFNV